jgi:hypothetical protein
MIANRVKTAVALASRTAMSIVLTPHQCLTDPSFSSLPVKCCRSRSEAFPQMNVANVQRSTLRQACSSIRG